MKESGKAPALGDEAAAVGRRLQRSAAQAVVQVQDPDLLRVLSHVAARRRARVAPDDAPRVHPTTAAPRALPTGAPGTLLDARRVTDAVRILRIGRPPGFAFVPGQHVKLGVPGGGRNSYTIASAPDEVHLEFCIEQAPGGRVSPRLFALRPGDPVRVDGPAKGSFTLVASARLHVMVATVTGIAPFTSMLRHAERRNAWPGSFVVLHGASFADELAYRDELESLAARFPDRLRYLPSVSRPADARNRGFDGATGRLPEQVASLVASLGRGTTGLHVYACGNPDMVATVQAQMRARGVPVATEAY
jgi:ferredoxin--NADP+ reductase